MYYERQQSRHYQTHYRHQSPSLFRAVMRFIVFIALGIAAVAGGLWLMGAAIGLVIGLFALAIGLAPVIILGWLVWLVLKAIFV